MKTIIIQKVSKTISSVKFIQLVILSLFLCSITTLKAQDILTFANGAELKVVVVELSDSDIRYKKFNNTNGPIYTCSKMEVYSIQYSNGTKDILAAKQDLSANRICTNSDNKDYTTEKRLRFGGPRFGLTAIGDGTMSDRIIRDGKAPFLTQFGYQIETRLFTSDNGATGIIEFVPLIAGMEQGMFLPSGSFLIGLRGGGARAFEFALGPNLSVTGLGMVFAVGTNFRSGNINFPVNLAVVPSVGSMETVFNEGAQKYEKVKKETGLRVTLTVGFNQRKK